MIDYLSSYVLKGLRAPTSRYIEERPKFFDLFRPPADTVSSRIPTGGPVLLEVPLTLPITHPALVVDGASYAMSHLDAFSVAVMNKGREPGTQLNVLVKFSNHVFTERALHSQVHHAMDHNGTKRTFDLDRYEMSLRLPNIISQGFED